MQKQTDSVRGELNGAITGVAVANDNTFGLNPALNVKRTPSARRQVDVQANAAILTELVKQSELAKVTLRRETPLIQIIDKPILPLKKERFGKAKGLVLGDFFSGFFGGCWPDWEKNFEGNKLGCFYVNGNGIIEITKVDNPIIDVLKPQSIRSINNW